MKRDQIEVGGEYIAKISGRLMVVRVDQIRDSKRGDCTPTRNYVSGGRRDLRRVMYDVTVLETGQKVTFHSSQKFRSIADRSLAGVPANSEATIDAFRQTFWMVVRDCCIKGNCWICAVEHKCRNGGPVKVCQAVYSDKLLAKRVAAEWLDHGAIEVEATEGNIKSMLIAGSQDWVRDQIRREVEAAKDLAVRTPACELDPSELEDQPEEVAKNRVREQYELKTKFERQPEDPEPEQGPESYSPILDDPE